jgi:hypothetical protein
LQAGEFLAMQKPAPDAIITDFLFFNCMSSSNFYSNNRECYFLISAVIDPSKTRISFAHSLGMGNRLEDFKDRHLNRDQAAKRGWNCVVE